MVRLNLEQLRNPQRAFQIVRETRSTEAAKQARSTGRGSGGCCGVLAACRLLTPRGTCCVTLLLVICILRSGSPLVLCLQVAAYCKQAGNHMAAIEFLLLAKQNDEAFQHATSYEAMDTFAGTLGDDGRSPPPRRPPPTLRRTVGRAAAVKYICAGHQSLTTSAVATGTPEEYGKVALYYEGNKDYAKAGQFYRKCGRFNKALEFFLKCGEAELNAAIEVVGEARSEKLTNDLIDFLMGEHDRIPKDPQFIFRLYMALGKYPEAVRTANIIAQQEQESGNYKVLPHAQRPALSPTPTLTSTLSPPCPSASLRQFPHREQCDSGLNFWVWVFAACPRAVVRHVQGPRGRQEAGAARAVPEPLPAALLRPGQGPPHAHAYARAHYAHAYRTHTVNTPCTHVHTHT